MNFSQFIMLKAFLSATTAGEAVSLLPFNLKLYIILPFLLSVRMQSLELLHNSSLFCVWTVMVWHCHCPWHPVSGYWTIQSPIIWLLPCNIAMQHGRSLAWRADDKYCYLWDFVVWPALHVCRIRNLPRYSLVLFTFSISFSQSDSLSLSLSLSRSSQFHSTIPPTCNKTTFSQSSFHLCSDCWAEEEHGICPGRHYTWHGNDCFRSSKFMYVFHNI